MHFHIQRFGYALGTMVVFLCCFLKPVFSGLCFIKMNVHFPLQSCQFPDLLGGHQALEFLAFDIVQWCGSIRNGIHLDFMA